MATKSWDTPSALWMNGKLVPWHECQVHVTSAYAQRGASIFEGIRIYKTASPRAYFALAFMEHLQRLDCTWQALSLPLTRPSEVVREALLDLLRIREVDDCYCRVTRFLDLPMADDRQEPDGLLVALYQSSSLLRKPVSCVISGWKRNALALPAQMKIGGNYFMLGWLRKQAQKSGADEAILLNDNDLVCEATGTAIFIFAKGCLVTPPSSDGTLPSITVHIVNRLAKELGIPTSIRSIHRTELFAADAAFLAGTLDELRPITSIDGVDLPSALQVDPVAELFKAFDRIRRTDRGDDWGEVVHMT